VYSTAGLMIVAWADALAAQIRVIVSNRVFMLSPKGEAGRYLSSGTLVDNFQAHERELLRF